MASTSLVFNRMEESPKSPGFDPCHKAPVPASRKKPARRSLRGNRPFFDGFAVAGTAVFFQLIVQGLQTNS